MACAVPVTRIRQLAHLPALLGALALGFAIGDAAAQDRANPLVPRTKGSAGAAITVYEMSDFQCPYCRMHALQTFPELERDYVATGKVRWVFINFPLTSIHANAEPAAEVALCAGRQDKFWEVHDVLFRTQPTWAPLKDPGQFFVTLADSSKLDRGSFLSCLQEGHTRGEVEADANAALRAGAQSTPTFYIEGGLLAGAQPAQVFREILDSILKARSR
jgi:protein-disulfide isomerase